MPQHIIVTEYDTSWPERFEQEAKIIKRILGENCIEIYHIGSTSVAGLPAKPIIDIMPVVKNLYQVDVLAAEFERAGYEYMGEFGISGRRYLRKGGDERTHHVHIFAEKSREDIERHLFFRDYLREHKEVCNEYARLKKELAEKYPYDNEGYCSGKDSFVKKHEAQAIRWKKSMESV